MMVEQYVSNQNKCRGNSIQANRKIKELLCDDYHLSCAIYDDVCDVYARHFAYKMRTYSQQIKD